MSGLDHPLLSTEIETIFSLSSYIRIFEKPEKPAGRVLPAELTLKMT
jgi:hypothetical protein